jgi:hypothetical protein
VQTGHLYISTGGNSPLTYHHAPIKLLTQEQLQEVLKECHTQEEWVCFVHRLNTHQKTKLPSLPWAGNEGRPTFASSALAAAMPGWKRKERYADLSSSSFDRDSISLEAMDEDLVILPSQDSADAPLEDRIASVVNQWESVVHMINKVSSTLCKLKDSVGEDVESLDN